MTYSMYIDDLRIPPDGTFDYIVRSSKEAINRMKEFGCPNYVSFDHDLGGLDTARTVVLWMIDTDLDSGNGFIPRNFRFLVHSANPVGAEWIRETLKAYLEFRD